MMPHCAVVIPVGPNCNLEFVNDTLDSIETYVPKRSVLILDDSRKGTGARAAIGRQARVLEVGANGLGGGLFRTLSTGFSAALEDDFDILLRIDTDALVASADFLEKAVREFSVNPSLGVLGSHKFAYSGQRRDFKRTRLRLLKEMTTGLWRNARLGFTLQRLTLRAVRNGYSLGESVMGGVMLYSRNAIERLDRNGYLDQSRLGESSLQEDHLFAICCKAAGIELGDFGMMHDDLPFGVKHMGLPASPDELIRSGKSLIHSTKFFGNLTEAEIRRTFKAHRSPQLCP